MHSERFEIRVVVLQGFNTAAFSDRPLQAFHAKETYYVTDDVLRDPSAAGKFLIDGIHPNQEGEPGALECVDELVALGAKLTDDARENGLG